MACQDQLLDLRGPLVDAERPYLAVDPLDRGPLDHSAASGELDRAVRDPAGSLGRQELCQGRSRLGLLRRAALVEEPGGAVDRQPDRGIESLG